MNKKIDELLQTIKELPIEQQEDFIRQFILRTNTDCTNNDRPSYPNWLYRDLSYGDKQKAIKGVDDRFDGDKSFIDTNTNFVIDWMDSNRNVEVLQKKYEELDAMKDEDLSVRWQYRQVLINTCNWLLRAERKYDYSLGNITTYFQAFESNVNYEMFLETFLNQTIIKK